MKNLLEHCFPLHYGLQKKVVLTEECTNNADFDLQDTTIPYIVPFSTGDVSFKNTNLSLSVIKYDDYVKQFGEPKSMQHKLRCDFVITDKETNNLMLLCEITTDNSRDGKGLSKPIIKNNTIIFQGGKLEKTRRQLADSLQILLNVPEIQVYAQQKHERVCLTAYRITIHNDETQQVRTAFNRAYIIETQETGSDGVLINDVNINSMGFLYKRISHDSVYHL
ncbi:MAG: hypothetical protein NC038_03395 [Paludibacter sp.]|nr:hypothetical protein [Bacteroidales bacterium]MCM1069085.1 hypothetical protein [Prevotella sp.]MCM1353524.1 hypothetical protein [Bacteroides sp.]MCM1442685.1 hypothetical protein [Muribaculum sp.]MCM1481679.1 hypothetical protein [Paludibacter sp.]